MILILLLQINVRGLQQNPQIVAKSELSPVTGTC